MTEEKKLKIIELYNSGHSYREIIKLANTSNCAISNIVKKFIKNKRTLAESIKLSRERNGTKLTDEGRLKLSENALRNLKKANKKIWTKPEQEFKLILNEMGLGVKFSEDVKKLLNIKDDLNPTILFQYPFQRYVCDFVDLDNKIIYAVNGDFWHANPLLYKDKLSSVQIHNLKHDKNRKIYLESKGFNVVDIWESELKWNRELVKEKIRASRKKANPPLLHRGDTEIVTQDAHLKDWSDRVKELWFKKPRIKLPDIIKECLSCKKEFKIPQGNKKKQKQRFCSNKCFSIFSRKCKRPSIDELMKEIEKSNYCVVGRKYGVADNTIRYWLKNKLP